MLRVVKSNGYYSLYSMIIDLIQEIRVGLEQDETRSEALERLVERANEWIAQAHSSDDWELLSELFSLEIVAIRTNFVSSGRSTQDALENFLPLIDDCPMACRIAAELELMDDLDAGCYKEIREKAEMAWTMGQSLADGGQVREALTEFLIGRSWLNSVPAGEDDPWMLSTLESCIGDAWGAWNELERSLAAYQRGLKVDLKDDPDTRGCLENNLGLTLRQLGRAQEAVDAFHRALELWTDEANPCSERLAWISAAEGNLGNTYAQLGDTHRALARQRRTVQINENLYTNEPKLENLDNLASSLSDLGNALRQQGMLEEGTEMNRRARDLVANASQSERDLRDRLATLELGLGNGLSMSEQYGEAAHCYRAAIMIWRELQAEGKPDLSIHIGLAQSNLAMTFAGTGEHEQALKFQKVAIESLEKADLERYNRQHLARAHGNLAYLQDIRENLPEAIVAYKRSCEIWREVLEFYPAGMPNLAMMERSLARIYIEFEEHEKARSLLVSALNLFHQLIKDKGQLDLRHDRAATAHMLGEVYFHLGNYSAAGASLSEACELWSGLDGCQTEEMEARMLLEEARAKAADFFTRPPTS